MKTIKNIILGLMIVSSIFIVGCKKDLEQSTPPNEQQTITQTFTLNNLHLNDGRMKSYNPDTWVYKYSTTQFELKFTGKYKTYTKLVSIDELKTYGITISMYSGVYDITYSPIHSPLYSDVLDIRIDMTNVNINGSPINLIGQLDDALIIVDIPKNLLLDFPLGVTNIDSPSNPTLLYNSTDDFYYGYTNINPISPLMVCFLDGYRGFLTINNFEKGKVYWFSRENSGTLTLTIPDMVVERINL